MAAGLVTWWFGGVVCLAVAAAYIVKQPRVKASLTPWQRFWLRWGHSSAWVLLAGWSFARAAGVASGAAAPLALMALLAYVAFIAALLRARRA
jgi:hypothetical protein